jgi:excisionase family DNA binding protein
MAGSLSVKQAANLLGYSTNSIYTFLKEGKLKGKRIGRGKFKIPPAEIEKFSGSSAVSNKEQSVSMSEPKLVYKPVEVLEQESIFKSPGIIVPSSKAMPSLGDWFVGIASIVYGICLFLFQIFYIEAQYEVLKYWIFPLRFIFIIGGVGLLFTEISLEKHRQIWHQFFGLVLVVAYGGLAYLFFLMHDYDGVVVSTMMSILLFCHITIGLKSIPTITFFEISIVTFLPIIALATRSSASYEFAGFWQDRTSVLVVWIMGAFVLSVLTIWGYFRNRKLYWAVLGVLSFFFICLAIGYAGGVYWGRAIIFLLTAFVGFIIPIWDTTEFTSKRERISVYIMFSSTLVLFVATVVVAGLIQSSVIDYAKKDAENKAQYAKVLIESSIASVRESIKSNSTNPTILAAVIKDEFETMGPILRSIVDGNDNIRAALLMDPKSQLRVIYPYDLNIEGQYFEQRDYFQAAKKNQGIFISDIFYGATKRPTIIVSNSLRGKDNEFLGVLAVSLDLMKLNVKLQEAGDDGFGDYTMVIDKNNRFVAHADTSFINTDYVPLERYGSWAAPGYYDESQNLKGVGELYAREDIDTTKWIVESRVSMLKVLRPTKTANIAISFLIVISILLVSAYLFFRQDRAARTGANAP